MRSLQALKQKRSCKRFQSFNLAFIYKFVFKQACFVESFRHIGSIDFPTLRSQRDNLVNACEVYCPKSIFTKRIYLRFWLNFYLVSFKKLPKPARRYWVVNLRQFCFTVYNPRHWNAQPGLDKRYWNAEKFWVHIVSGHMLYISVIARVELWRHSKNNLEVLIFTLVNLLRIPNHFEITILIELQNWWK